MNRVSSVGREAIEHARRGNLDLAIQSAMQAIEDDPGDLGLRVFLGLLHSKRMELPEALFQFRAAVQIAPADSFPRFELVRLLIAVGELDEASAILDEISLPGLEPARLRAAILQARGDSASAAKLYRSLVQSDPADFESWGNLGLCLIALDQPVEAIGALGRSLALRPDRVSYWYKWAEAHLAAGTAENALAEARGIAEQGPGRATIQLTIAHLENLLGRPEAALEILQRVVRLEPANAKALIALAGALERQNDLQGFEDVLRRIAGLPEKVAELPLLEARLAYRKKDYASALQLARTAPHGEDAGTRAQLIGQCLDKLGEPTAAFEAFTDMNREDSRSGAAAGDTPAKSRASIAQQREMLNDGWVRTWKPGPPPSRSEPAFLVGFPRSGTTLLDTLLMGHPGVAVAEEKPMLLEMGKSLGEFGRLAELHGDEIEKLRTRYFQVAAKHVSDIGGRLLIDKFPFGLGSVPIIHRLFPTAPIIFMERHPCDVVLSCFMTRFQPTQLATNFLRLEDTALLYDEMMKMWERSIEVLPVRVHFARYEDLVSDPEEQLRRLADFLDIEWAPELLDHRATARKRKFIGTPSYSQVIEPVNAGAVNRWQRYSEEIGSVLHILEPWIRKLNYGN